MYSEVYKRHQISLLTNTKYGQNLNSVSEMNNVENIFCRVIFFFEGRVGAFAKRPKLLISFVLPI